MGWVEGDCHLAASVASAVGNCQLGQCCLFGVCSLRVCVCRLAFWLGWVGLGCFVFAGDLSDW